MLGGREPSKPMQRVLQTLLAEPGAEMRGTEIAAAARLRSGVIYPVLARLERLGWLESRWEAVDELGARRPARRCYRLTGDGMQQAEDALAAVSRRAQWRLRPVTELS
jgi:DNA-binding PadR family transcriptional regulator